MHGIIFVVDAHDEERFDEAAIEFKVWQLHFLWIIALKCKFTEYSDRYWKEGNTYSNIWQ